MSNGWNTPATFPSDGVTGPGWASRIMGYDRYQAQGRRHDFECRYSDRNWKDAREYFLEGVREESPVWMYGRIPIFWTALWIARDRCKWTHPDPMPPEWEIWIDRNYRG